MNDKKQFIRRSWLIDATVNSFDAKAEDEADNYNKLIEAWMNEDEYDSSITDPNGPVKFEQIAYELRKL